MLRIVLIGPQGCGKGTQAKLIAEKYGIPHIATGDLLREAAEKGTPEGLEVKKYFSKGKLVPEKVIIKIIEGKILSDDCKRGFVLDGFPRNLEQAEALDDITEINFIIVIDAPDELSIKRISSRQNCSQCRRVYGIDIPPKKKGMCDTCKGKLIVREDDKPELVKKRLEVYHDETEPLMEYYKIREDVLQKVDGSKSVEEVFKQIVKIIEG